MDNKKVSIIVPVYNAEKYVERCLKSLLGQSYENMEIIIVDDGSTDGSKRICDTFALKYDRIKLICICNSGVSAARNRGLDETGGDYFAFVDADDCLEKDAISYLVKLLEETNSDIAGCDFYSFSEETAECLPPKEKIILQVLSGKEFIEKGILSGDTRCWAKLYKKETVGNKRFESGLTIGEDMLFLLELVQKGAKVCRSSYKGYGYFVNESGAMKRQFQDSYMDQILCWKKAAERIEKYPEMRAKVISILMISIMLVVGKLAAFTPMERAKYAGYIKTCVEELRKCNRVQGAYNELPLGYKVKTFVFGICPKVYINAYHVFKGRK